MHLHKIADRSYTVTSDVDAAVAFLSQLFDYAGQGKPSDLYAHRWRHDGPAGRTMVIMFKPHPPGSPPRLSLLGPAVAAVDALAVESEVAK